MRTFVTVAPLMEFVYEIGEVVVAEVESSVRRRQRYDRLQN